jgi:AraC family transcriptional regulator, regulatory protein of adaptative response / DNA-3-methyladenine glycosylase II
LIERRLSYTPPLAADALFRFLGDRTIPGVESFDGTTFRRAVRTPETGAAVIELAAQPDREEVRLRVLGEESVDPSALSATARRLLDLDADSSIVDAALSSDPSLRPLVRATPGLRLPGTADGFELVVRAILGQQISVRSARTFAGRIAEACGTPLERPVGDVTRLFPTAERLAASSLDGIGLTTAREATLRRVAELVASGELDLSGEADLEGTHERLLAVRGIGPWTVAYVSMRALGDRDAFPAEDLGVRLAIESLGLSSTPAAIRDHAERWRPWRAYAVMYLWNSLHS